MRATSRFQGRAIAVAAAAVFAMAPLSAVAAQGEKTGHCVGVNSCKGQSDCKTASSACKGQNACKGSGYKETTKADCDKQGGKFEEAKADKKSEKKS